MLAVVTAPLSVDVRSLLTTGVMPPVLLIGSLFAVALFFPDAIVVDGLPADAGALARTIAAVIDHGITLVVGHVLALVGIVVRVATARLAGEAVDEAPAPGLARLEAAHHRMTGLLEVPVGVLCPATSRSTPRGRTPCRAAGAPSR